MKKSKKKAKQKEMVKVLVVTSPTAPPVERMVPVDEIDAEGLVRQVTGDKRPLEEDGYYYCRDVDNAMTLLAVYPLGTDGEPPPQALTIQTDEPRGFRGAVVILGANHETGATITMNESRIALVRAWQAAAFAAEGGRTPVAICLLTRETRIGSACWEVPVFADGTGQPIALEPDDPFGVGASKRTVPPGVDPNDPFGVGKMGQES